MWRVIIILVILGAVIVGGYFYYQQRRGEARFLSRPIRFTAHAYSVDGLNLVPLYQDAHRYTDRRRGLEKAPDKLYQGSVEQGDKLYILDAVDISPRPGVTLKLYLVKTKRGGFGYIPDYFLSEKDGTPLAKPPRGLPLY